MPARYYQGLVEAFALRGIGGSKGENFLVAHGIAVCPAQHTAKPCVGKEAGKVLQCNFQAKKMKSNSRPTWFMVLDSLEVTRPCNYGDIRSRKLHVKSSNRIE